MIARIAGMVLFAVVSVGCGAPPKLDSHEVRAHERRASAFITMRMNYLLHLPEGYADPSRAGERWPLLIFLHGIFENGKDLNKVLKYGPSHEVEHEGRALPFILVTPQNPNPTDLKRSLWNLELLTSLLEDVKREYRVDADRVYVSGVSLGGLATWQWAVNQPEAFAAIVPVSGWGFPDEAHRIAHVPVWAFHGGLDFIVSAKAHREMVEAHRAAGGEAKLTVFDGGGHDIFDRVYGDDAVYEWLLEQER